MKTLEQLAEEAGFFDEYRPELRHFAALVAEQCAGLAHKVVSAQHAEDLILAEFPKP